MHAPLREARILHPDGRGPIACPVSPSVGCYRPDKQPRRLREYGEDRGPSQRRGPSSLRQPFTHRVGFAFLASTDNDQRFGGRA